MMAKTASQESTSQTHNPPPRTNHTPSLFRSSLPSPSTYLRLLSWTDAAADDTATAETELHKILPQLVCERVLQRAAVDDQSDLSRLLAVLAHLDQTLHHRGARPLQGREGAVRGEGGQSLMGSS